MIKKAKTQTKIKSKSLVEPLSDSKINIVFQQINELAAILFRGKKAEDNKLMKLFKMFHIKIPGGLTGPIDRKELQRPEFLKYANEMITIRLYHVLNQENGNAQPECNMNMKNFYFFIGPGNNAKTVREVLKRRVWWQQS